MSSIRNTFDVKPIKRLDQNVVNRISAGEVVHRPVNVVKELVENCMDAKANRIEIILKEGGIKMIEIRDNGSAIRKQDLDIVCERFTTSKLQSLEDLLRIESYGFRGEALAAISHISYVTIVSKTKSQLTGFKQQFVDGKPIGKAVPIAANNGTIITVDNLFYNVPNRKKALSSSSHEYNLIHDLITKYSVHYSNKVAFTLKKYSENSDINTNMGNSIIDNIVRLYESNIANNLIEISFEDKDCLKCGIKGLITNQNVHKSSFVFILFINDRLVDCNPLKKAIDLVYSNVLMKSCHPFIYLDIQIDSNNIDVNIHPTKSEVKFLNEQSICEKIVELIENKLSLRDINSLAVNKSVSNLTLTPIAGSSKSIHTSSTSINKSKNSSDSVEKRAKQITCIRPNKQVRTDSKDRRIEEFLARNKTNTKNRREIKYRSVLSLREEVVEETDPRLQDLICHSSYVGCVDQTFILIQSKQQLILTNAVHLSRQLFYQLFLIDFGNFSKINLSSRPLIRVIIEHYLQYLSKQGENLVDIDSVDSVETILMDKREMISDYFAINISDDKRLISLPLMLENYVPNVSHLGQFLYELATEVEWNQEKECFRSIGRVLSRFYAKPPNDFKSDAEHKNWAKIMESTLYPTYKSILFPPKSLSNNCTFFVTTSISDLYKVFERC